MARRVIGLFLKGLGICIVLLGAYFFVETAQLERGFLNFPKSAEVQTGKVYPKQVKGGTVYLTEDEIKDFERKSEYYQAGLIIGCFAMGIGALVDRQSGDG